MNKTTKDVAAFGFALLGLFGAVASLDGCTFDQTVPNVVAKVASATPAVVADLAAAGALAGTIASQIAAANPNNAKIVAATAKLQAGVAITNADAAALAPAVALVNGAVQVVAATAK